MPKKLRKSLKIYLSKLKKIPIPTPPSSSILSTCKYPKTPSFDRRHAITDDAVPPLASATLADVDRFLFENFQSLYPDCDGDSTTITDTDVIKPSSDRFFISPDRTSSSLIATSSSPSSSSADAAAVPGDGVAVRMLSRNPYEDFLRSMKEMIDSQHIGDKGSSASTIDWDFMEELLFCYMELNDRAVHKYILKAFTDLTAGLQRMNVPGTERRREQRQRRKVYKDLQQEDNYSST